MGASSSLPTHFPKQGRLVVASSKEEPFSLVGCRRVRFGDGPAGQVFFPAVESVVDQKAATAVRSHVCHILYDA